MPLNRRELIRLLLAVVISPGISIAAISIAYYGKLLPLFFLSGYLFFILIGLPIVGMLLKNRRILSCAIGGGCTAVIPPLLVNSLSFFATSPLFTLEGMLGYFSLFFYGCVGGAFFWLIAFAGQRGAKKSAH